MLDGTRRRAVYNSRPRNADGDDSFARREHSSPTATSPTCMWSSRRRQIKGWADRRLLVPCGGTRPRAEPLVAEVYPREPCDCFVLNVVLNDDASPRSSSEPLIQVSAVRRVRGCAWRSDNARTHPACRARVRVGIAGPLRILARFAANLAFRPFDNKNRGIASCAPHGLAGDQRE